MRRNGIWLIAVLLVLVGLVACAPPPPEEPLRVEDPRRVVALAPSVVELLYDLDLGDRLVGVGDHCKYPAATARLPKLGGLFDPHLEQIARLDPDLAILLPSEARLLSHLGDLEVEVLTVKSETLDDVEAAALTIARRFSVEERGERFVEAWREALAPNPLTRQPRVLLAISRHRGTLADTISAGPDTFYNELLERMGAINVFGDAETRYPQVNLEEAMQRLPDAILDLRLRVENDYVAGQLRKDWNDLTGVPALDNECYRAIGGDYVLLPGPRLPRLYREIRDVLVECGF